MITPTDDSSRLNARPRTFSPVPEPSNSTISPVITPERPWTLAMPSPTSSTRPTSVRVTSAWNFSISLWITELISSALNFMRLPFDQSMAELLESAAHRGVVYVVADLDDQPPDQGGIDLERQQGRRSEHAAEPVAERFTLRIVERDGRADEDRAAVLLAVPERPRLAGDRGDQPQPTMPVEHPEEPDDHRQGPVLERGGQDPVLLPGRHGRRGQQRGEPRLIAEHVADEIVEIVEHGVGLPLILGGGEQRLGIRPRHLGLIVLEDRAGDVGGAGAGVRGAHAGTPPWPLAATGAAG